MVRTICVQSLHDARAALTAAAALGCPVTLISAPAAAAHGGCGWFRAMIAAAAVERPEITVTAVLDCADLPGLVLAGVRAGVDHLRFSGRKVVAARLSAIAGAAGVRLYDADAFAGPQLDLRGVGDPVAACRAWLSHT
ncbi:MAG: hypothetical protein WCK65_03800 [Rhodospirillaceae bacterium]